MRETNGTLDAAGSIAPLAGTLAKGAKKSILRVEALVNHLHGGTGTTGVLHVAVNGVLLENGFGGGFTDGTVLSCTGQVCLTTGTFWLDLDAAETANPGMFVGQPLSIVLTYTTQAANAGSSYAASFSVQVSKKK